MNNDKKLAFDTIMTVISQKQFGVFFMDGLRGIGRTYLYRALLASVRAKGSIILATTTFGIATTLLPGGRTTHSRFKISINPYASSVCSISK